MAVVTTALMEKTTTDKGRRHGPQQGAVADPEALLVAHCQPHGRPTHHQMVTGGPLDAQPRGTETSGIGILFAECQEGTPANALSGLRPGHSRWSGKTGLRARPPWAGGFDLGFDHFCHEPDGIGVQTRDGLARQWLSAQQQRFSQAKVVGASGVTAAIEPVQIGAWPDTSAASPPWRSPFSCQCWWPHLLTHAVPARSPARMDR
jgi:hypothetical protein